MHSAKVVLPEPAWPSKTIFFTCEVSNSGMAICFRDEEIVGFEFNGESQ
jgi:hypothetical protein